MTLDIEHDTGGPFTAGGSSHLADESETVQRTVRAIARLLGEPVDDRPHDLESFTTRHLGCAAEEIAVVGSTARGIDWPLVRVEIARRIAGFGDADGVVLRDDTGTAPPGYDLVAVDVDEHVAAPDDLAAYLPGGTVFPFAAVLVVHYAGSTPRTSLRVRRPDADSAREALGELYALARGENNFYRGRTLRVVPDRDGGIELVPTTPTVAPRADVVHTDAVWNEVDVNVGGLVAHGDALVAAGLGASRGLLLVGPPGVGKTALTRVIAGELPASTTVLVVEAGVGAWGLARLYDWVGLLAPAAVLLDDIDLLAGNRRAGGAGPALGEFLNALDGFRPAAAVLTVASTNVSDALDPALLRPGRFDAIVEVGAPDLAARARILLRFLGVLADTDIDVGPVAARTDGLSGADLREIVRRAVLENGTGVTAQQLVDIARSGRWRPQPSVGQYL